MVSGADAMTAPLYPSPPSISSSSTPSSDAAYVAFTDSSSTTSLTSPSTPSTFLSKLRPYRRWLIAASAVLVILLITAAYSLTSSSSSHPRGSHGVVPGDNNNPAVVAGNSSCPQTPIETEGPYWVDEKLNRSDLASTANGLNLALELLIFNASITHQCLPIVNAQVDIWHADALGLYSDEQILKTQGKTFLRGYQLSNAEGVVSFLTIWPGWYQGRTIHIHVRVRVYDATGKVIIHNQTTQLFFDDSINDAVMAVAPYNTKTGKRDTRNDKDGLYHKELLMNVTGDTKQGYSGSFAFGVPFVRSL